jgi:hypothetical protein
MWLCHRGTLKLIEMMSQRTKDEDAWGVQGFPIWGIARFVVRLKEKKGFRIYCLLLFIV